MKQKNQEEHISILRSQPLFSTLDTQFISALADISREVIIPEGETIIKEGDLIDCFYIIVKGKVEVSKEVTENGEEVQEVIATNEAGEAIGLSTKGFYSTTGSRTATVTAQTEVTLLMITLNEFQAILEKHPEALQELKTVTETLTRIQLIKQVMPFASISPENLLHLAQELVKREVPKNEILFREGDEGDICYLLLQGALKIYTGHGTENEKELSRIVAPNIVGESSLLMHTPRSATVITDEDCVLLEMTSDQMMDLRETENRSFRAMLAVIIERARPKSKANITAHKRKLDDGEEVVVLCDPEHAKYFQITESAYFIWEYLDGMHSVRDLTEIFRKRYGDAEARSLSVLIFDLAKAGFVTISGFHIPEPTLNQPVWSKIALTLGRIMEAKYAFTNADGFVGRIYNHTKFLFTKTGLIVLATIAIVGFVIFLALGPRITTLLQNYSAKHLFPLLIMFEFLMFPLIFLHEMGHAVTTKYYNRKVLALGFGWYWLGPIAFTDTSDMWLSTAKQRAIVNSAGIFVDFVLAGIIAIIALFTPWPLVAIILWFTCMGKYSGGLTNFNPLMEFDGYYVLADVLDEPNLREKAIIWLTDHSLETLRHPSLWRKYKDELIFWGACLLHIIVSLIIAWIVQQYVLSIIFPFMGHSIWAWILPGLVLFGFFMKIRAEIRLAGDVA